VDSDLSLVVGIMLVIITIPSLLSAWTEGRPPRVGALLSLAGLALVALALMDHPGRYTFDNLPSVFGRVFARYVG
jgi:hypothetical protein